MFGDSALQAIQENSLRRRAGICVSNLKWIIYASVIAVKPFIYKDLTMNIQPQPSPRFIRKTQLGPNEYRKNFQQIDREILSAITSSEADAVTPLMSKIYLRMVNAPVKYWEREGVLRIEAEMRDEKPVKAWSVLCDLVGVASGTASKALQWMHDQGIIGYFSGKNGVGLRVFLNRAVSSVGVRPSRAGEKLRAGEKILAFSPGSSGKSPASPDEPAFNDSYAVREISDTDINPVAPKNGAGTKSFDKLPLVSTTSDTQTEFRSGVDPGGGTAGMAGARRAQLDEIIARLKSEIEPGLQGAAARAAAQATRSELERTRMWFETRALPKAVRVAQSECYSLLKKHGSLDEQSKRLRAGLDLGRHVSSEVGETVRPRTPQEINEMAEVCLALLETQGQAIDVTLSEVSKEGGGWLLPEDAPRVRAAAELMLVRRETGD